MVSVSGDVMSVAIPNGNSWEIGATLDENFNPSKYAIPFTTESWREFSDEWDRKLSEDDRTSNGVFKFKYSMVTSQEEMMEALDLEASLSYSSMCYSADAHMKFASENIAASSEVSVIVKATSSGRNLQMTIADRNELVLEETSDMNIEEFTKKYGYYMIIGFEYGGEILFQSTTTTSSSETKEEVQAELKFGIYPWNVSESLIGCVLSANVHCP